MGSRGRKQSGFEQMVSAPWQFGAVTGVFLFVVIRYGIGWYFSSLDNPIFSGAGESLNSVFSLLAWVALGICWLAAVLSFLSSPRMAVSSVPRIRSVQHARGGGSRTQRTRPIVPQAESGNGLNSIPASQLAPLESALVTHGNIGNLSWFQFEQVVAASFRRRGFDAELTAEGPDGGVDIMLRKSGDISLVQCKHWDQYRVGIKVVRELFGVLHAKSAQKAILVTSSQLTSDARRFCEANGIDYFDRGKLLAFVDPEAMPLQHEINADRSRLCPFCSSPMKRRRARKTGNQFYGCSRYPRCKGTRSA